MLAYRQDLLQDVPLPAVAERPPPTPLTRYRPEIEDNIEILTTRMPPEWRIPAVRALVQANPPREAIIDVTREMDQRRRIGSDALVEYDQLARPHLHATPRPSILTLDHYLDALHDVVIASKLGCMDVTRHLPFETQYRSYYDLNRGEEFMDFVERAGEVFGVRTLWENGALLDSDRRFVEKDSFIPPDRALCMDIGHLMLGQPDRRAALREIDSFLDSHGPQIALTHLHLNDGKRDMHVASPQAIERFLGPDRFERILRFPAVFERAA